MIEELFTNLGHAIEANYFMAVFAAFAWGFLTVILSPCNLTSIPLVIAYVSHQQNNSGKKPFFTAGSFSAGTFIAVLIIAGLTITLGRLIGNVDWLFKYLIAGIFILFGLIMMEVIDLSWQRYVPQNKNVKKFGGAMLLGLVFGLALGPCTFAFMAPVLAVTAKVASENLFKSFPLVLSYGIGYCSIIVLAGTFTGAVQSYLNWDTETHFTRILKTIFGVFMVIIGLYLIYKA